MALADDIRKLAADTRSAIHAVLDYYHQSRVVWELIADDARNGRVFSVHNPQTGTVADQAAIIPLVPRYIDKYLKPATFQQLLTIFEAWFFDLLATWLSAHPGILYKRQVDVETILAAPDTATILQGVIERELNEVKYRRVADWFDFLRKLVGVSGPTEDEVAMLAEAKAGRDILVHNRGVVNAVYVAKSRPKARYVAGDILELPEPYFHDASDLIEKVVADVSAAVVLKA